MAAEIDVAGQVVTEIEVRLNLSAGKLMDETTEPSHPLDSFSLNIRGVKCFDDDGSGFFNFAPITFIIGKNNSGKSTVLDVLEESCKNGQRMFDEPLSRTGSSPNIEILKHPDEAKLRRHFRPGNIGGLVTGDHFKYAKQFLLPRKFVWTFDKNRKVKIRTGDEKVLPKNSRIEGLLKECIEFPFSDCWTTRISAERDVQPEASDADRQLSSTGGGLTNLVRAFINSDDLPRAIVETELLCDLNEIYLGDSEFTAITCQEHEATRNWELYLREDGKGDIRLSQSGSSLRTIFLILAFLRLYPAVQKTESRTKLVFCLEEPENNLHPALLRRLIDYLARQREEDGFSLVISTHSPICIDLATKRDDATILHVRREKGRTVCGNALDYAGKSNILEDLDVRGSDILQANGIIWVEGPSDRIYLKKWIEVVSKGSLREGTHYTFMFYGGKVLKHFDALPPNERPEKIAMLAVNRNIAVVIDSDRRPAASRTKTGKQKKPRMNLNETKNEIIRQVENIGGYAWVTAGKEIENYIPHSIWVKVAGQSVTIKNEFVDLPKIPALAKVASTKVDLAHEVECFIDNEAIDGHLDLKAHLEKLCSQIRGWNGLA